MTEVEHLPTICDRGISADRQLAVYDPALESGATQAGALAGIVQTLIADTLALPDHAAPSPCGP